MAELLQSGSQEMDEQPEDCRGQRTKVGSWYLCFPPSLNFLFPGAGLMTQAGTEVLLV